jgi:hypothetical protein
VNIRVNIPKRSSSPRPFGWADGIVLLALIGLLVTLATLGHGMWVPFPTDASRAVDLAPRNHRLPEAFFLDLLEKHFSPKEARRQLETAIQWGRYAELFGFEDDTDELFLETSEPA